MMSDMMGTPEKVLRLNLAGREAAGGLRRETGRAARRHRLE
jgi:hypothetical protein